MIDPNQDREGLAWQTGVWNRISDVYLREIDQRFTPVVEAVVARADLGTNQCDIVLFQQTAGKLAGPPPVEGVGPGSLADPAPFLAQLEAAGIETRVETQTLGFDFPDFASAWDALAGVTTAQLPEEQRQEAKNAVMAAMYPAGDGPRRFRNVTQIIVGQARR
jgi:hypothetical protein